MERTPALLLTLLLLAFGFGCQEDSEPLSASIGSATPEEIAADKSNVILITIDTLRADALGAYGQKRFTSPNLDQLATEGVLFSQAMSSAPNTLPSHASIMTGKYPNAHGARSNGGYTLSSENDTLAEALKRNGYRTGAEIAALVINHGTQLNQGFDHYRDLSSGDITKTHIAVVQPDGSQNLVAMEERTATDITKFGIEFLQENKRDPFFLWLHYFDPHAHYAAPQAYHNLVPDSNYHAEVRFVDAEIGRLMRHLRNLGLDERTIVVMTSDHGESLNEHDENTHSAFLYQTTMHVPLIVWGAPSILKDWRVETPVRTIDIAPTILALLDLPPLPEAQGRSLLPLMEGRTDDLQLTSYGESIELHTMFGSSILRYLRRGDWKYIHSIRPKLFDLAHDPGELENLAAAHPDKVEDLQQVLHAEIRDAPASPGNSTIVMDEQMIQQLQALGYVGADQPVDLGDEIASLELKGPDASDLKSDFSVFAEGWFFSSLAEYDKAIEIWAGLADRHPSSLKILTALGHALMKNQDYEEAAEVLLRAIEADPKYEKSYGMLAQAQLALGLVEEATATSQMSLEIEPCQFEARIRLAGIFAQSDRKQDQLETLKQGVEACPDGYEVLNNYAYLLSTSPDPEIRDAAEAVRIARLAVEKSGESRPEILDTLAGAYSAMGQFDLAVDISERAVEMSIKTGMEGYVVKALQANLARFRAGKPIHEP